MGATKEQEAVPARRDWWATGLGEHRPETIVRYDAREPTLRRSHLSLTFCGPVKDYVLKKTSLL